MTQTQALKKMFEDNGGRLTLGQIMQSYLSASYRQRITDCRRELSSEGKTIVCYPNRADGHKSETYWQIENLPEENDPYAHVHPVTYVEPSGQMAMVIR